MEFLKPLTDFEPASPICWQSAVLTVGLQDLQTYDELCVCYHAYVTVTVKSKMLWIDLFKNAYRYLRK